MEGNNARIIESAIILLSYVILRWAVNKSINGIAIKYAYAEQRVKIIKKLANTLIFLLFLGMLIFIWGVDQSELIIFASSLLTILGIAFIAQWSFLSNITSTLIIFFNHPTSIGDSITVIDKDYQIEGKISDIGVFFIILETSEGEKITMPSNIFMQKMIRRKPDD